MGWRPLKFVALGCLTYVPGLHWALRRGTGGSNSARYCYSVWMRHLVHNYSFARMSIPSSVAELGPGDSLGVGIAALLSGAERYLAFDALPHAKPDANLEILDELVALFESRAPIPNEEEFPGVNPKLEDYRFPSEILGEAAIARALESSRLERLRSDIRSLSGAVSYQPGWHLKSGSSEQLGEAVDLIFSQAVLEHVDDLEGTYRAMFHWLRPGGMMSHQIDFKCHSTADTWNGHLAYSDLTWRLMRGNLPYFINRRLPYEHIATAGMVGFDRVTMSRVLREDGLPVHRLNRRFQGMSDTDAKTAGGFLQALRPHRDR